MKFLFEDAKYRRHNPFWMWCIFNASNESESILSLYGCLNIRRVSLCLISSNYRKPIKYLSLKHLVGSLGTRCPEREPLLKETRPFSPSDPSTRLLFKRRHVVAIDGVLSLSPAPLHQLCLCSELPTFPLRHQSKY